MGLEELSSTEVRGIRRSLGLTQAELAEKIGVSKVTVSRWETDRRRCKGTYATHLQRLATREEARRRPRAPELARRRGLVTETYLLEQYTRQFREATRLVDQLQPQLLALEQMMPQWERSLDEMQLAQARFALPASYLRTVEDVHRLFRWNPAFEAFSSLADTYSGVFETIQLRQPEIDQLINSFTASLPDLSDLSIRIRESMVSVEAIAQAAEASRTAVDVLLGPQAAFQEFVDHQLQLVAAEGAEIVRRNRLLVLDSSTDILQTLTDGLEFAALTGPRPLDVRNAAPSLPNVFSVLEHELGELDLSEGSDDPGAVVSEGRVAQLTALGYKVVHHVYLLNVGAQRNGRPAVFKPTNRGFLAGASIVTKVATDEASFSDIVEHLYLLLYEGSGDAKRLVDNDDHVLAPLWLLKHLRRGARHDLDHGRESHAARKHKNVGDALRSLTGLTVPRSTEDWIQAQTALYDKLVGMLIAIWSRSVDEE